MYPNDHDFNFYSSENDGYRGGFGDYTDPVPQQPQYQPQPPKKGISGKGAVALALACAIIGGASGVGGAAVYNHLAGKNATVIYQNQPAAGGDSVSSAGDTVNLANTNNGQAMTPAQLYGMLLQLAAEEKEE